MEKVILIHNARCKKSRAVANLLKEKDISFKIIEYMKNSLTDADLREILKKLNMKPLDLMRKKEEDYKVHVKDKNLSDDNLVNLMIQYPKLIERPIVIKEKKAVVGRPMELVLDLIGEE